MNEYRCQGPCRSESVPLDAMAFVTNASEGRGYCLTCFDAIAAKGGTEAAGIITLRDRSQQPATPPPRLVRCAKCGDEVSTVHLFIDFGASAAGVDHKLGVCLSCGPGEPDAMTDEDAIGTEIHRHA